MADKKKKLTKEQAQEIETAVAMIEGNKESQIVMPAVDVEQALSAWKKYQELKEAIAEPNDVQMIQGNRFLKKSYWRKIATFFNLSVDIVTEEEKHDEETGNTSFHFVCKATAPNGRFAIGSGSCDIYEKANLDPKTNTYKNKYGKIAEPNTIHNARSTAETRAWNRAVSNLVGGGEVSAEEMGQKQASGKKSYKKKSYKKAEVSQDDCDVKHKKLPIKVTRGGKNKGRKYQACDKCDFFTWK